MAGNVSNDPNEFLLPDLGEGLHEAELVEWCVEVGQQVNEADVLAKVETDKALSDVTSPRAGTIAALHGKPGQRLRVGALLVTFKDEGSVSASNDPLTAAVQRTMEPEAHPYAEHRHAEREQQHPAEQPTEDAGTVVGSLQSSPAMEAGPGKVIATPAVRRLARDLNVDITTVSGSGIGGRITERDVRAFAVAASNGGSNAAAMSRRVAPPAPAPEVEEQPPPPAARPPMRPSPAAPEGAEPPPPGMRHPIQTPLHEPPGSTMRIPFRGIRRTIAERLRQSVNNAVHFTVMDEADVSALDDTRRRLVLASGAKISFLPFVAAAVCRVLSGRMGHALNRLNSTVDDPANEIVQHRSVHLGIATETENGLMVPVVRDADSLGLLQLQQQIAAQAKAARDRTIPAEELRGGTFTISNFGSLAGRFATPIINYPESAILAVGRARDGVVVRGGMLGVGKLLPLSLSADHRVIDGATAAMALAKIIELLQSPEELMPAR